MLYDLNIAWSPSITKDQLLQTLTVASSLGYGTVALNHTYTQPLPSNPTAPFPDLTSDAASSKKLPQVLHRATLPVSDPAASNYRLPVLVRAYDLLAVRPLSGDAFQNACITLDIPIISLDLSQRLDFLLRPKTCMAAVSRGVFFEVCYSQAFVSDGRARAAFIGNLMSLVRATKGRGIIVSSEAKSALGLRGPADVVNMLSVWELRREKGLEGLRSAPRSVVVNEGIKRSGFRGVIDIVQTAQKDPSEKQDEAPPEQPGKKSKKQKRKNGDEEGQPDKRQNKKIKVVTREADSGSKK